MSKQKNIVLTWEEFGKKVDYLIVKIRASMKVYEIVYDGIYGVPRGGLPLAVILSHHLDLPLLVHPTAKSLVVDDISDTGITLSTIKHRSIATIFSTPWTSSAPNFYMDTKEDKDCWVCFPWENTETEGPPE